MSTTIGLGYFSSCNADLASDIHIVADNFNYGLLNGISYAESDVRKGLECAQKHEGWKHVAFLQSPKNSTASLAFGIQEELTALEAKGQRPQFFDFLIELTALCSGRCEKLGIFLRASGTRMIEFALVMDL